MDATRTQSLALAALVPAVILACASAKAAPLQFGFTGFHALPADHWSAMDHGARAAFVAHRAGLATRMGASVLRLGDVAPRLVDMDRVHAGLHRDWTLADAAVAALVASGARLCLTLPELVGADRLSEYGAYIVALAERYDGDLDYGIEPTEVNYEFPDIDGSGTVTVADWEADEDVQFAWVEARRIDLLEVGYGPRLLETTGQLATDAYADQLKSARFAISAAKGDQRVMLAGTIMDHQGKSHFTQRLDGLSQSGAPWFDVANAVVFDSTGDLTQATPSTHVKKLSDWLAAVDHPDAERWLGEMAFGSAPATDEGQPCQDPRCSERTQVASLVKMVARAAADGFEVILVARPIEHVGDFVHEGEWTNTGLVTLELVQGMDPTIIPVQARPAYAVWRELVGRLSGIDTDEIVPVTGLPLGAHGVRIGEAGWLLWYDWTLETQPGEAYGGGQKLVTLTGLDAGGLSVRSLWPVSVGQVLDDEGAVETDWNEEIVPVDQGKATLLLGEDPVWVELGEAPLVEHPPDAGSAEPWEDVSDAATAPEPQPDTMPPAASSGGGGCGLGPAPGWTWWALASLLVIRRRS